MNETIGAALTNIFKQINKMHISPSGIQITKRFFEAIETLKKQGVIGGLQTFTKEFEINRWNMVTVKNNPDKSILKPEWIYYLCHKYNISTNWIILGQGNIFNNGNYNFNIDTSKMHINLSEIERHIGQLCTIKYIPKKNIFNTSGKLQKIRYCSRKNAPVIELKSENPTTSIINIYNIQSIETL
jgi:hypothetical protein